MINKKPTRRDLAVFGLMLPLCFAVVGVVVGRKSGSAFLPRLVWGAGGTLTLCYLVLPAVRRPIFIAWSYLTYPLGWIVSHVLLVLIFFVVLTPIGLVVRLLGHDLLHQKFDPSVASYWTPRQKTDDFRRYFQQF
jgi:Saxitoxin biosynthesis operon protein SxtJ